MLFVLAALAAISCGRETEPTTAPELPRIARRRPL
jgi:hypothetical protein